MEEKRYIYSQCKIVGLNIQEGDVSMVAQEMDYSRKFGRVVFVLLIMQLFLGTSFSFGNKDDAQPPAKVNWDQRIENLLVTEKGDIVVTAVGDMIFNQEITGYKEPDYQNLLRIMQDAHIAYGNLEMSLNEKPEEQRGTYQFGRGRDFGWEIAKTGINLVSLGNNHQLDYGPEGLKDCLRILRQSGISFAGAGSNLGQARAARIKEIYRTKFALISFYSAGWRRSGTSDGPVVSTLRAPKVMLEKEDGTTEEIAAPLESDVKAMEDAIVQAKRHADIVMVHFHLHWVPHSRAYPMPNKVPPHQTPVIHKAIDAGADIILGNGPHVLRGIEIYKGKPILYSQGNFIYQWKTPDKIPAIVFSRDQESMSGYEETDRSQRGLDPRQESETYLARFTIRDKKFHKLELIPVTLNVTGPRMGSPRLANDTRGKEIIEYIQELSAPYNTKITYKDWYGVVELKLTEEPDVSLKN
jgi:poly-gamma-glutamate synthesis protein (capsule biosynthesis protein)